MAKRIINRAFSTREKVLILILVVVVIAALYYFGVVRNVADTQAENDAKLSTLNTQIVAQQTQANSYAQMRKELDALGDASSLPVIGVYDNVSNELQELNGVLAGTSAYNLSFEQPELDGTTVRRSAKITFTVGSYADAINIASSLLNGKYRCQLMSFDLKGNMLANGTVDKVNATMNVVFYETTKGSTNTQGLVENTSEEDTSAAAIAAATGSS